MTQFNWLQEYLDVTHKFRESIGRPFIGLKV
jgi:hypothetical protein